MRGFGNYRIPVLAPLDTNAHYAGKWGMTPVSVVQSLTHRDVSRTHTLMLFREMDVLSLLRHPYIVQLLGMSFIIVILSFDEVI